MADERSISIEVVYRGIFQKTLAQRITRSLVLGGASFAGLWVYKDDHTDYRVLGAIAKVAPKWLSLENAKAAALELAKDDKSAADSVQYGYDATVLRPVKKGEGTSAHEKLQF